MADILQLFPARDGNAAGVVRESDSARARMETAARLREVLLDDQHATEQYGWFGATESGNVKPEDLMTPPDEVRWGSDFDRIANDMESSVLRFGGLVEGLYDVVTSLPEVWLPGVKGDAESEEAAIELQEHWEMNHERDIALRWWCRSFARGFSAVEPVWDVDETNYIYPAALFNRPRSWFGFDYLQRPRFKPEYRTWNQELDVVPEFKVAFARCGSLHTPYGHGFAEDCYPAVWTIDTIMKRDLAMVERYGYLPAVVKYPKKWRAGEARYRAMVAGVKAEWKNALFIPADVDDIDVDVLTEGAYAAANAIGTANMQRVARLEEWLAMRIQGSAYSSSNQEQGSFARDQTADTARLWKAPTYASVIEATVNRGFVRPCMMVNRPNLPKKKWPHYAIDASFGEDLQLLLTIFEAGTKMKFPIAAATFAETFKIRQAQPGEAVLESAQPQQLLPAQTDQTPPEDASRPVNFSEGTSIVTIYDRAGNAVNYFADSLVYTENRGVVRASLLQTDDIPVVSKDQIRAVS
jgi:hypothetical protein